MLSNNVLHKYSKHVIKCSKKFSWSAPKGYDTGIKVYNCATKAKEKLIVQNKNAVTWYTCGPTVYDSCHIGHASSFVKFDIIQSILTKYFDLNIVTVMNITDIDDKIIKKAASTKSSEYDISKQYEREFWTDLNALKVARPNIVLRVTENIDLIIDFIKELEKSGKAYKGSDGSVYFNVRQFENIYGKLQNLGEIFNQQKPHTIKKSPMDFALWKSSKVGEPYWESPWGDGRPGWHTECSAMASYVFGSNVDIHAGGIDLRFPHHENEEVQCCAFHNTEQWVNYWIHTGHLHLKDSEKMSKSIGNVITIQDMLKSTNVEVFRFACAMMHYRSHVEYSQELLRTAENKLKTYNNFLSASDNFIKGVLKPEMNNDILKSTLEKLSSSVNDAFCNDFDTPKVIRTLDEVTTSVNSMLNSTSSSKKSDFSTVVAISNVVKKILDIFNVQKVTSSEEQVLPEVMDILLDFRKGIREKGLHEKKKEVLSMCDDVRNKLSKIGISLKDYKDNSVWNKV